MQCLNFLQFKITFLDGLERRPELRVTKKQHLSYDYIFERGCVRCVLGVGGRVGGACGWVMGCVGVCRGVCRVWGMWCVCVCVGACVGCGAVREI